MIHVPWVGISIQGKSAARKKAGMMGTPMVLHFYNDENEKVKTVTQLYVPWKVLKEAAKIQNELNKLDSGEFTEADIEKINGLVVSVFNGKITSVDLDMADFEEVMAVFTQILNVAKGGAKENPTPPGK